MSTGTSRSPRIFNSACAVTSPTRTSNIDLDEPKYESVWQIKTGKPLDGYRTEGLHCQRASFTSQERSTTAPSSCWVPPCAGRYQVPRRKR